MKKQFLALAAAGSLISPAYAQSDQDVWYTPLDGRCETFESAMEGMTGEDLPSNLSPYRLAETDFMVIVEEWPGDRALHARLMMGTDSLDLGFAQGFENCQSFFFD